MTTPAQNTPYSLYLHIPFCTVRCAYCDFNTYAGLQSLMRPYVDALTREIDQVAQSAGARLPVHSVFLGGGTPSLLPLECHAQILSSLTQGFALTPQCEISLEANPGTVNFGYLQGLRQLGYNRISFGVQSANPRELKLLDRLHDFEQVLDAVRWTRAAGFENLNLDLIYGLPNQQMADWQNSVRQILALQPEHFSIYALSLENGTPMKAWVERGLLPAPDADLAANMAEWAGEQMQAAGYWQYEIANWARSATPPADWQNPDYACRHNLQYWYNRSWLGFGAGAHGFANSQRYSVISSPTAYIERLRQPRLVNFPLSPAVVENTPLSAEIEMDDTMMLGFRLVREGIASERFQARFQHSLWEQYQPVLASLAERGLVEILPERVRLAPAAYLLANEVFREFV